MTVPTIRSPSNSKATLSYPADGLGAVFIFASPMVRHISYQRYDAPAGQPHKSHARAKRSSGRKEVLFGGRMLSIPPAVLITVRTPLFAPLPPKLRRLARVAAGSPGWRLSPGRRKRPDVQNVGRWGRGLYLLARN